MILLTGRDTGRAALVDERDITYVDTISAKPHPFSRIYLRNVKENHDFSLDVEESSEEISRKIRYEKLDLGCEARENK